MLLWPFKMEFKNQCKSTTVLVVDKTDRQTDRQKLIRFREEINWKTLIYVTVSEFHIIALQWCGIFTCFIKELHSALYVYDEKIVKGEQDNTPLK